MTDQTVTIYLLAYSATILFLTVFAYLSGVRKMFTQIMIVLSAGAVISTTLLGNQLAGVNFALLVTKDLMGLSRTVVVATMLGVSCAIPVAIVLFGDIGRSRGASVLGMTVLVASFCGTLLFGSLTAARELISPYLSIPDTQLKTGAFGRLTPPEFELEEFLNTSIIPIRVAVSPEGRIYVSGHSGIAAQEGVIVELRKEDDTVSERVVARMLNRPYGLLATSDALYVSRSGQYSKWTNGVPEQISTGAITRLRDVDGDGIMDYYHDIVSDLPGAKGPDHLHQNNDIVLGKDGSLYITTANHSDGHPALDEQAGAILRAYGDDFEKIEIFAQGLRNPFGLAITEDGTLYATDNDAQTGALGGNLGDKLLRVKRGDFFGHPYAPDDAKGVTAPLMRSPYALGGLAFADSELLPDLYRHQLFVVVYGEGRIMRVVFEDDGSVHLDPFAVVPGAVDIAAAPNGDFYVGVYPEKIMRLKLLIPESTN